MVILTIRRRSHAYKHVKLPGIPQKLRMGQAIPVRSLLQVVFYVFFSPPSEGNIGKKKRERELKHFHHQ